MSIFGIKDLDYKLTEFLDNKTLFSLQYVNKYYLAIFDEIFWKRRFYLYYRHHINLKNKYINKNNYSWKKYYKFVDNLLSEVIISLSIYKTIKEDMVDLFFLLININNMKFDKLFNNGKFKDKEAYNYICESSLRFMPINLIIENDSIDCFKSFFKMKKHKLHKGLPMQYFIKAIRNKSNKIVKYMVRKKLVEINVNVIKIALMYNYLIPGLYEN